MAGDCERLLNCATARTAPLHRKLLADLRSPAPDLLDDLESPAPQDAPSASSIAINLDSRLTPKRGAFSLGR
jgi:hypothetical protein